MELSNWECILMYLYKDTGRYALGVMTTEDIENEDQLEQLHHDRLAAHLQEAVDWSKGTPGKNVISNIVDNMENAGLIEVQVTDVIAEVQLTQEGFGVAHDVRVHQTQTGQNREIIYLTAFLAVSAIINAIATMANPAFDNATIGGYNVDLILGVFAVALFVGIALEYYREYE